MNTGASIVYYFRLNAIHTTDALNLEFPSCIQGNRRHTVTNTRPDCRNTRIQFNSVDPSFKLAPVQILRTKSRTPPENEPIGSPQARGGAKSPGVCSTMSDLSSIYMIRKRRPQYVLWNLLSISLANMDSLVAQIRTLADKADEVGRNTILNTLRDLQYQLATPNDFLLGFFNSVGCLLFDRSSHTFTSSGTANPQNLCLYHWTLSKC